MDNWREYFGSLGTPPSDAKTRMNKTMEIKRKCKKNTKMNQSNKTTHRKKIPDKTWIVKATH